MINFLKQVKTRAVITKYKFVEILTWPITKILSRRSHSTVGNSILLIPAANLDGGFGEDIMIFSFLKNFAKGRNVTIFTQDRIVRQDYVSFYPNLTFTDGLNYFGINFLNTIKLIKKHSTVFVIGADVMDGTYSEAIPLNRLKVLELAHNLNIETQISGFSISNRTLPSVKRKFAHVSDFMIIKSRDVESYKRLINFVDPSRTILTNDIAFICPDIPQMYESALFNNYSEWCKVQTESGRRIIGVCPNSLQARELGSDRYVKGLIKLLDNFLAIGNFSFVFLYHDIRPLNQLESDSTISKALYNYFVAKAINCFYKDTINNGVQLKGYLSKIDFTITGRMHFGISGITYGKPMFGIAYANKFEGMVKLFGIEPLVCLLDYDKLDNSSLNVKDFLEALPEMERLIRLNLNSVQENTMMNFSLLK